jgi:hypothetical protein
MPIPVSGCRRRTFDLSIAQTFVLLSSLIYERDAKKVKEAYNLYKSSRDKVNIQSSSSVETNEEYIIESRMRELLWESEFRIRQIAETWGLHFAGVSELKSLGGPFCGKYTRYFFAYVCNTPIICLCLQVSFGLRLFLLSL